MNTEEIERHIRRMDRAGTIELWIMRACTVAIVTWAAVSIWRLF